MTKLVDALVWVLCLGALLLAVAASRRTRKPMSPAGSRQRYTQNGSLPQRLPV